MLIYLLRHGLTAYNAEKRYQGQRDIPLCPAGRAQLRQADLRPETVYITPLCRTRLAAMERYALPHADYYHWCAPNAGGYVLDAGDWAEQRVLHLLKTVQYTKEDAR